MYTALVGSVSVYFHESDNIGDNLFYNNDNNNKPVHVFQNKRTYLWFLFPFRDQILTASKLKMHLPSIRLSKCKLCCFV